MADQFAPPEDAGALVEAGAAAGGLPGGTLPPLRHATGLEGGSRGVGHPRRHLAASRQPNRWPAAIWFGLATWWRLAHQTAASAALP